jgi:uncharacterized cupredoxin-like copper-binding protein
MQWDRAALSVDSAMQITTDREKEEQQQDTGWLAHVTWTQIGTALNTLGVFVAIGLAAVALGIAVNHSGTTKIVTQAAPATKAATTAAAVATGPITAALGDGPGGPPNASSMWIGLSRSVNAGNRTTFHVNNVGHIVHEFVVIKTDKRANGLGTGQRVPEAGNVGETGDVQPGASKSLTLKLKPGHYALICNIPGHYAAGMHTDFVVR